MPNFFKLIRDIIKVWLGKEEDPLVEDMELFIQLQKPNKIKEGFIRNDAHIISEITGLSSGFWGVFWIVISLGVITHLIHYAYKKA